jgi:hypothetical protein
MAGIGPFYGPSAKAGSAKNRTDRLDAGRRLFSAAMCR